MSANGRPAGIGYPHYLGWQWDPSCRARRIDDMLSVAADLTIETMAPIQNDVHDKFAETMLPMFLDVMIAAPVDGGLPAIALAAVSQWDYVCDRDAIGAAIWLRWFDQYRSAVWDDEFEVRGIERKGGSWGFSGDNRREPMLEVLEYLTREMPNSQWFDDRRTPERETRNDLIRTTFATAVQSLAQQLGDDVTKWAWRNINILRVRSLTERPELAVEGGPVPGGTFTVNPGSNVGHVGGGASWRMIVDFGDLTTSVGAFPGGQSENPMSPHYADLMPFWGSGTYVPLRAVRNASELPQGEIEKSIAFGP
jgi:penicillin amidase